MSQMNAREMQQALAQPFAPEDLEWRVQNTNKEKTRGMAVPYVTNRAIQNRLDEVCGPENWYNDYKPWHSNGKKDSQLCGIAIYFEGKGFITKWDGAEDSDIESIKGGLSDSMKRAAVQWGIGRVLYDLNTVWVDLEQRGNSCFIKDSERARLDSAYLSMLQKLGLTPAAASGIQSLLTPKSAPEQNVPQTGASAAPTAQNGSSQQPTQIKPPVQPQSEPEGKTVPFTAPKKTAQAVQPLYTVLNAKIQGGMSGSNTLVTLKKPDGEQMSAFARGPREELVRGVALANVKLTMRQQDTVVFHVLEAYEVITSADQAA